MSSAPSRRQPSVDTQAQGLALAIYRQTAELPREEQGFLAAELRQEARALVRWCARALAEPQELDLRALQCALSHLEQLAYRLVLGQSLEWLPPAVVEPLAHRAQTLTDQLVLLVARQGPRAGGAKPKGCVNPRQTLSASQLLKPACTLPAPGQLRNPVTTAPPPFRDRFENGKGSFEDHVLTRNASTPPRTAGCLGTPNATPLPFGADEQAGPRVGPQPRATPTPPPEPALDREDRSIFDIPTRVAPCTTPALPRRPTPFPPPVGALSDVESTRELPTIKLDEPVTAVQSLDELPVQIFCGRAVKPRHSSPGTPSASAADTEPSSTATGSSSWLASSAASGAEPTTERVTDDMVLSESSLSLFSLETNTEQMARNPAR